MSDSAGPFNPPPLPPRGFPAGARPIAYHDEAEDLRPWAKLLRTVAAVGVVVASASLAQKLITLLSMLGFGSVLPPGFRSRFPFLVMAVAPTVLLLGSIGCLALRPYGRKVMIAYVAVEVTMVLVQTGFTVYAATTGGLSFAGNFRQAAGFTLHYGLGMVYGLALPLVILALMLQPPVRRVFERQ